MSLFSSANSSGQPNMDVQHLSRECPSSESSLTLLTSQQEISFFQPDFLAGTNSRLTSTGHNNSTTNVEERSCSQPPHTLWTLPQKRSNQSLTAGRVGDPDEPHPRVFSGIFSAKRLKGPITPPLPSPLSSCNNLVTTGLSQPLLDLSDAKAVSPKRAGPAEATEDQLDFDRLKPLRSPFEFRELVASQVDRYAKDGIQRFDLNRPMRSENSSGYIYYAPTNPSDKTDQTLHAHRRVPRRQLSYGDPRSRPGSRPLHRTTGSWELRHEAERHAEDLDLSFRSDSTSNVSAARPYHSEPIKSKPRLWLDLSEQDKIQEAVSILKLQEMQKTVTEVHVNDLKHAITIRTSPSKPQVISTPRRRVAINTFQTSTSVCPDRGFSIAYPHTPPPTPASVVGLGIESVLNGKYDEAYERIKAKQTWTQTPPSSNPSSTVNVRRVPLETTRPVRADTPRPTAPVQLQPSEFTYRIITELEASVASIPQVNLQLDSPVIFQICLPAGQRRVPRETPPGPPSRYSNFNGPLSSHPTHSAPKFPLQAASGQDFPVPPTIMRSLHIIFPHASSQLLSSLQATYLALHYISAIHLPSPSSCSPPISSVETHSPLSPNMSYIPAKARAMLGLQTPTTRPGLPSSWTRSETRGWRERIEDLECKLRSEVVRFIRMCEGSDLGKNDALVRAVGQVVSIGQEGRA
ncbi:hypothetical protein HO173_008225 [Letharia columbiana]|uniref:Uncharacterized protein n=1 Tax=Letharia columbiana TaxID=112416 RepID=A0A8H6FS31_9LECA|nr:uncharacterized protein HO173_008225 [Letharia columbiana]KAF6233668.1 hypothetical protein HO173_008225 [Letharia columbiana]